MDLDNPIPEEDMNKFTELLQHMARKFVDASGLPQEVRNLREQVEQITRDLADERQHNAEVSDLLSNVRRTRDEALAKASELELDLNTAHEAIRTHLQDKEDLQRRLHNEQELNAELRRRIESLTQAKEASDNEAIHQLDRAETAENKLRQMADMLKDLMEVRPPQVTQAQPTEDPTSFDAERTPEWLQR